MAGTMNPDVKAQWLTDLRSAQYPQAKGHLRDPDGFCCLGVLAEQAVRAKVCDVEDDGGYFYYGSDADRRGGTLPLVVTEWAGLVDGNPALRYKNRNYELSTLNDEMELTFAQIADLIDEQL